MPKRQFNIRLPEVNERQLEDLRKLYGGTITQVMIIAIDRLYREVMGAPVVLDETPPPPGRPRKKGER